MKTLASWAPAPNLTVTAVESEEADWIVSVNSRDAEQGRGGASCPVCGIPSSSRHSSYIPTLRDLSAQGRPVKIQARLARWRCRNDQCDRRIFAERLPVLATPFARRTARLAGIVRLFGHSVGGRSSERLMARVGMPVSDTTILRSVKECAGVQPSRAVDTLEQPVIEGSDGCSEIASFKTKGPLGCALVLENLAPRSPINRRAPCA
jgi:transposase